MDFRDFALFAAFVNVESSFCDRFRLLYLVCLYRCVMLEIERVNSKPGGVLVKDDVIQ